MSFPALLLWLLFLAGCNDEAVQFNDTLVSASNKCETSITKMYDEENLDDTLLSSVMEICLSSLQTVEKFEVIEGGENFKDEIIRYLKMEIEYLGDLQTLYPLLQKEDFSEDDMVQYQTLADKLTQYEALIEERFPKIEEAQKKFAEENHIILSGEKNELSMKKS